MSEQDKDNVVALAEYMGPEAGLEVAKARLNEFRAFVKSVLKEGIDFGAMPGTAREGHEGRKCLLKPGAERILQLYGLTPTVSFDSVVEDFSQNPPLLHYRVRVIATNRRTGEVVGEGVGCCNSMETKYRYRSEWWKDKKSQPPPNEGWERVTGKWGASFKRKIPNPETADLANTILKIAKKRALVDCALTVGAASEFFTQDLEELAVDEATVKQKVSKPSHEALIDEHNHVGAPEEALEMALEQSILFVELQKTLTKGFKSVPHRDNWLKKHKSELEAMPEKAKDKLRALYVRAPVKTSDERGGEAGSDVAGSENASGPHPNSEETHHGGEQSTGGGETGPY